MQLQNPDYQAFFDSNLAVRLVLDPVDGRILKCNHKACSFYGLTEEELLKRSIDELDLDAAQNVPLIRRLEGCDVGHVERIELRHQGAEGEVLQIVAYVELIEYQDRNLLLVGLREISGLMKTRQELQEFRERYELAVRGANEGIWDWNIVTNTSFWSDRCKELLGYAPHEVDSDHEAIYDYTHPDDTAGLHQALVGHLRDRTPFGMEFRLRCKGGEYRWFQGGGQAVWDKEGAAIRMAGSLRDITERIEGELCWRKSEQRFNLAVAGTQQGIWDWDLSTGEYYWSPQFKALLGYAKEELSARQDLLYELMHPEDVARVRDAASRHLVGEGEYDIRYRLLVKGSGYQWFRSCGQALFDSDGNAIRVSGSLTNVHESAVAEMREAHRAARVERQHEAVLGLATDPTLCDDGFRAACAQINETACKVLDVGRCSVMMFTEEFESMQAIDLYVTAKDEHFNGYVTEAKDFAEYFALLQDHRVLAISDPFNDPRTREFPKEFLDKRSVHSMLDVSIRRAGVTIGSVRFSEVRAPRIWREDEINFAADLAQQVARVHGMVETNALQQHQQELEKRVLQAQKLESLGVMAGGIAHDFNNLLVVIMGNSDLVGSMLESGTRERELVNEIENASRRAAELCQQMLAYSGHTTFESKIFDLSTLVEEMTHLLRASITQRAQVEYRFESGLPFIAGDPTQVRQVIMNLIVNASEAVGDSGGNIQVKTGSGLFTPGDGKHGIDVAKAGLHVYLEVRDDGCGMTEDVLERIYDPFFSTKFTGRGLGLASILGIMRACGGGIGIKTAPGQGSTFQVLFPVAEKEMGKPPSALLPTDQPSTWRGSGKALLVDDDQTVLLLTKEMLSRLGYKVLMASEGQEAVELYRSNHQELGLVFLDLTMPHMDGEETLRHMKAISDKVPVVMSSGYTAQDVAQRIGEMDFAAFVQKPFTLDQLQCALSAVFS